MKKAILTVCMAVLLSAAVFAQTMHSFESDHYKVRSELGAEHAEETARMMEAYFDLFQSYLHFREDDLASPMKIRIFREKSDYDSYVDSLISETRDSFVFLHYQKKPEKSELAVFHSEDSELYRKRLVHHGFIQYIKSFIPNPPLWLQKGFAVYFEQSTYNEAKDEAMFRHNYSWIPFLREVLEESDDSNDLISPNNLLYIDGDGANRNLEAFYAQSWGMIQFLVHSDKKSYNRLLWDSISALSSEADKRTNERTVVNRAFEWVPRESLISDFIRFVQNVRTFPDLVDLGMESYSQGNYDDAERHFLDALKLDEDHYAPHYYLGLIYYEKGEYSMAEYYYQEAERAGGDKALIRYALGVNAYADRRLEDAEYYLAEAQEEDSSYSEQVERLLKIIEGEE
ncbi:MAG: tetratricopeptide repeat protein [Spirochaetaceae bacterium]